MISMRDKLIELITVGITRYHVKKASGENLDMAAIIADVMIEKGVIVPPCKVGDTVYRIWSAGKHGKSIANFVVTNVSQIAPNIWIVRYQKQSKTLTSYPTIYQCNFEDFGKTVFLTREEAEAKLKGDNDEHR